MTSAKSKFAALLAACVATTVSWVSPAAAQVSGRPIQGIYAGNDTLVFQHQVALIGLERLGYIPKPLIAVDYPAVFLALSKGEADFTALYYTPLFEASFEKVNGAEKLVRFGPMFQNALQGYLIDKKTADKYGIKSLDQMKDPKIAKLFDSQGDGKAHLTGCNAGWGCEGIIEHQMKAYDLQRTVTVDTGSYFALMASTIARFKKGEPIFYWVWQPLWVNSVLVPGKDVEWLTVPYTSLPGDRQAKTVIPDGRNLGTGINDNWFLVNKEFASKNPIATRFFEQVRIPIDDISAENLKIYNGEKSQQDIRRHAEEWIAANRAKFDSWIENAKNAK